MKNCLWPRAILPGTSNPICIRTTVEGDLDKLATHFERLSQSARYNRFMGAVGNFSKIARDCVMPQRKADFFTLVVERREAGFDAIIGEASYGFDRGSGCGEFAISVSDRFQRHGLGSSLMCALQSRAMSLGHLDLFGETLKTNDEMKRLAQRAGFASLARLARSAIRQAACGIARRPRGRRTAPRAGLDHSRMVSPEPPNSLGKSFSFGRPSRIGSTVSA
jgi:RimJ/RimL family protein N-acetyltransferase